LKRLKQKRYKISRVGLLANSAKSSCAPLVRKALALLTAGGREVFCDHATSAMAGLKCSTLPDTAALANKADLLLVFGGDGTILRVAREMNGSATPVLGIKIGGLGFLTAVASSDLPRALEQVWKGAYTVECRSLIEARADQPAGPVTVRALNDIVITRGIVSRLIELEVRVDGDLLTRYRCDGLIICSPTGSTAYSLAAGGAVVYPTAEVLTITPICPHTLSNRSVIVSLNSTIEVTVINKKPETILSADGQGETGLAAGDIITIRRSRHAVRLVRLEGGSFFQTLRRKLQWSGSHIKT
jgi:NAD+ kinase